MNSSKAYPGIKSAWLMPLRLITFCLIFGVTVVWMGYPSYLHTPFLSYCIFTLGTLLVLLFLKKWETFFLFRFLVALHFISEIACEAGIVYTSGNLYSTFAAFFLLTIVSAAMIYRLAGTLIIASLVSISFIAIAGMAVSAGAVGSSGIYPGDTLFQTDDIMFYTVFLHTLIFYLVAFIAGYLAEKLQLKDRQLTTASAALEKAKLETGDILHHLNSGLLTIDRHGKVVYFNRAAEYILTIKASQVSELNCQQAFGGRLIPMANHLISVLESRQHLSRAEIEITSENGEIIPVGISASLLFDENDRIRGLIAIFQDITAAKKLEERIRHADRMAAVGELSAYIAHEIRNPLASISGSVEVLKNDLALTGDNEKLMELIIKETARLNKILSDFLLYARVGRTQFRKVELHRVISDTMELVRRHPAFSDNIKLNISSQDNIVYISGDEDQLKQLILNLAVNACEVLGDNGGQIEFFIRSVVDDDKGERVCLIVRDNGPGIPPETRNKIFLPFFSTKRSGTGLGLAIVSRLMEAHGGSVELSSAPESGTEFRLYFKKYEDKLTGSKLQPNIKASA